MKITNSKHPEFGVFVKIIIVKASDPHACSIVSFFPFSFFFQVLFVNGRVDQVMNNVSASLLPSNLLLGMDGALYMAGQIDEVQLYFPKPILSSVIQGKKS